MPTNSDSTKSLNEQSGDAKRQAEKKLVEELKVEWKLLWSERFDDKERAEGVSVNDYERLYVERGTIIHATKNFKALNFKDILKQHIVENPDRYIQPDVNVGGWNKFIKTKVNIPTRKNHKRASSFVQEKPKGQQAKKGGRGWLHTT